MSPRVQREGCASLSAFSEALRQEDVLPALQRGLIGEGLAYQGAEGEVRLRYADYAASGRALEQVERFITREVLPYYANSHTRASLCGATINRLRAEARATVARLCGADERFAVVFAGNGATAAANKVVHLLLADASERPLVITGPYEHHSNILPWRESHAEIAVIDEAPGGGPDLAQLEAQLRAASGKRQIIGAFSAASNVTGIRTDVLAVTRLLKAHGALAVWDYAAAAPYLPMSMQPAEDAAIDALFFSPHKFIGGPGASGVLVVRRDAVRLNRPTQPGGGTVAFVSPWGHDYLDSLEAREEAGTPNIIGDIRTALAMLVKDAVGDDFICARDEAFAQKAMRAWREEPLLDILGDLGAKRLPVFSFRVRDGKGGLVHHALFTRMLSDYHGVQARGGCGCAGPYAHQLLGIDQDASEALRREIQAGAEITKPGWVRVNFSWLMSDEDADFLIGAVLDLARRAPALACRYCCDPSTAQFLLEN